MDRYPFIFSDEPKYRIRRHLIFWIIWWLFQGFLYSFLIINQEDYAERLLVAMVDSMIFLTAHIFLSYSLMYFVIPKYVLKEKYVIAFAWVITLFIATAGFSTFLSLIVLPPVHKFLFMAEYRHSGGVVPTTVSIHYSFMAGLRGGITIGGLAAAIKLMKSLYLKEQRNMQLKKENAESQLQLLKAQVHPHFLFNTLNNIYSFTQNTSPQASKLVTGLSDLLRFILYECNQPLVPLSKELKMIRDYIELEKVRYGNELELHLDLPTETNDLFIAPLLLLPLIENCFKHGTSQILEQPWVSLHIDVQDRQMQMKLLNGKSIQPTRSKNGSGIGIYNVEKRLELLYPGKHEMTITDEEDVFIVNLKIELERISLPVLKTNPLSLTHA
ncbi:MAG: sensor histidine kinase [Chitinophagaceae bacterium]